MFFLFWFQNWEFISPNFRIDLNIEFQLCSKSRTICALEKKKTPDAPYSAISELVEWKKNFFSSKCDDR